MTNAFTALALLPILLACATVTIAALAAYRGSADISAAIVRSNAPKALNWSTRDAGVLRALRFALPTPARRVATLTRRTGLRAAQHEAATVVDRSPCPSNALPTAR
jgi:hypothetical protein